MCVREKELTSAQELGLKIYESVNDQPPSWRNWLSRQTSERLVGPPVVLKTDGLAIDALCVSPWQKENTAESDYLKAFCYGGYQADLTDPKIWAMIPLMFEDKLRRVLNPSYPRAPEVSDRIKSLQLALRRIRGLGTEHYEDRWSSKFESVLRVTGQRLVDKEADFFKSFRLEANKQPEAIGAIAEEKLITPVIDRVISVLDISKVEADYLRSMEARESAGQKERYEVEMRHLEAKKAVRKTLNPNDPNSPEVCDRLNGLLMAYDRISTLIEIGDQEGLQMPNFPQALKNAGKDLVDAETEFYRDFRAKLK